MSSLSERYENILKNPNISDEIKRRLRAHGSAVETQQTLQAGGVNTRNSFNADAGIRFFGLLEWSKPGYKVEGTENTKPGKVTFVVHDLETANVTATHGKYVLDTEPETDERLVNLPHLDTKGNTYIPCGEKVVKVFVRGDFIDPTTGQKNTKAKISTRPIVRVVVVREGDRINCSSFTTEEYKHRDGNKLSAGDYVLVNGVRAHNYRTENNVELTMWNCGKVVEAAVDTRALDMKLFEEHYTRHPRNSYTLFFPPEPPITDEDRKHGAGGQRLSKRTRAFLATTLQFYSWGSDLTEEKWLLNEMQKKYTIVYQEPIFTSELKDYMDTIVKQGEEDKEVKRFFYQQMAEVYDMRSTPARQEQILLDLRLGAVQAEQVLGMKSVRHWKQIAPAHLRQKDLRFSFTAKPNHELTAVCDVNDARTRDESLTNVSFQLVFRPAKSVHVQSNLFWYALERCIPVSYEFLSKRLFPNGKLNFVSDEGNYYNKIMSRKFINLNEYTGDLNEFQSGYVFRMITSSVISAKTRRAIDAIEGEEKRAKACSDSLSDENEEHELELGYYRNKGAWVVFAIANDFVEEIRAKPDEFSMLSHKQKIEQICRDYDHASSVPQESLSAADDFESNADMEDDNDGDAQMGGFGTGSAVKTTTKAEKNTPTTAAATAATSNGKSKKRAADEISSENEQQDGTRSGGEDAAPPNLFQKASKMAKKTIATNNSDDE